METILTGLTWDHPRGYAPLVNGASEYEKLNPRCQLVHEGMTMQYSTPTTFTKWRVESFFEKEPSTVEWLAGFAPGAVLVDVGANVGMYSIWAAVA